ncbi:MAG: HRDC domain-containing protein [Rudaea sp.]
MHEWLATSTALDEWLAAHSANASDTIERICLDTEFMRTNTFFARLALIQIGIGGAIALVDAPALARFSSLATRLSTDRCVTVMHSASEDLEALSALLPAGPAHLFDTQIAAAMIGLGPGLSYQKLVAALLGIDLPKSETRSDWLQRPLTPSQLEYAAHDVEYLDRVHELLEAKLAALGRAEWHAEDCRRLVDRVCAGVPDLQPQRGFRAAGDWPIEQQAQLRRLLLWREASARALDKPRSWLLDDAALLDLGSRAPASADELFERTKGLRALRSPQRRELLDLLNSPLGADDLAVDPVPPPPDGAEKRAVAAMKDIVEAVAIELDVPATLLAPRRHLEALVGARAWPQALEGWRRHLLHDALMARLPA